MNRTLIAMIASLLFLGGVSIAVHARFDPVVRRSNSGAGLSSDDHASGKDASVEVRQRQLGHG